MHYGIAFLLLIFSSAFSTGFSPESNTVDYGTVEYDSDPKRELYFVNSLDSPLIIYKVTSSCGCMFASWPKEQILPREKNKITVHYLTKRIGRFSKTLTVYYGSENQSEPSVYILYVKGEVLPE
ncbi:MAG: DUF1573 domain-containing protein [Flavobacteriales bacterium]|nr:DUF1573 domain-containing protein [Flavobacteriales bacterium]